MLACQYTCVRDFLLVEETQAKQSLFCNCSRKRSGKPFNTGIRVEDIGHAWP
jgi:hypothetical protein